MPASTFALNVACSFSGRQWRFRETDETAARELSRQTGVSSTLANLLMARSIPAADVADYLNPTLRRLLPEPFLLKDMERAVARALRAVMEGETVAVFGDYDVDGSCSAALLHNFFSELGRPPLLYIPDRLREGYGPNAAALLGLRHGGASLVITVDCGATADGVLAQARNAGLDTIVLDHHAADSPGTAGLRPICPGEMPAVPAIHVNPNQPDDGSGLGHLCAAGVTFLFTVALSRALRQAGWFAATGMAEPDLRKSLDLVGLATVCDVVPLVGINRAFVRAAEVRLSKLERPGIRALAAIARSEPPFSLYHCGFVFGPRINAGGRVGRCSLGAELLTASAEADTVPLAELLELHNRERQAIETAIIHEAIDLAVQQADSPFLFVSGEDWHPGVVGIVAGRLKDRFRKPVFAIGINKETCRGSARSVPGVDIGALVRAARDLEVIATGGGHAMAAGFSLSAQKMTAFKTWLETRFAAFGARMESTNELWLDSLVCPAGATPELVDEIGRAGPFGAGNQEPVVAACDVRLAYADVVGQGHVRLRLQGGDGAVLSAIAFRAADTPLGQALLQARGTRIHAAGALRRTSWNGRTETQLQIEDAAAAA
ncbi:MAG TPA: single-stranded-DNA-specific exonuclease RecJ [Rhizomicrobium sp.]|nr:single-stranded-DNA-specific exonuclease RecJ [Rhizomicrobium sp.]